MCIIGRSWLGKYSESVLSSHETARVTICPKLTESELPTYGFVTGFWTEFRQYLAVNNNLHAAADGV